MTEIVPYAISHRYSYGLFGMNHLIYLRTFLDAVKHLVLCRVERRPPRLDLSIYPYLPKTMVEKTSAKAYMRLLSSDA